MPQQSNLSTKYESYLATSSNIHANNSRCIWYFWLKIHESQRVDSPKYSTIILFFVATWSLVLYTFFFTYLPLYFSFAFVAIRISGTLIQYQASLDVHVSPFPHWNHTILYSPTLHHHWHPPQHDRTSFKNSLTHTLDNPTSTSYEGGLPGVLYQLAN